MARINTNVSSLIAQFNLSRNNANLGDRLERLSTGLRINSGADDPAGLIISERLQTEIVGTEQAIENGERASSVIATTEAALIEVTDLLNTIKALMVESANTGANSQEERDANQLEIDSAIDSITRISNTASFGRLNLLDGSLDYITSGINNASIARARVNGASFVGTSRLQAEVDVLASAQQAQLYLDPNNIGTGGVLSNGVFAETVSIKIRGDRGVDELTFASNQTLEDVVQAVNDRTSLTGVTAELVNGADFSSGLVFESEGYGSNSFVSVEQINTTSGSGELETFKLDNDAPPPSGGPPFNIPTAQMVEANRDEGKDVLALINGTVATGDGLEISINSRTHSTELLLTESFATDPTQTPETFDIIGGGATFQLGPEISALQQENIGVQSVSASELGGVLTDGGLQFLSSLRRGNPNSIDENTRDNDFSTASDIIDKAIDEITVLRGRLGAFERNVLETNQRSLQAAQENLTASRSTIRDADFAKETSELTRAQVLQQSTTSALQLANQTSQSVLALLG